MRPKRKPRHTTDDQGQPVVLVPLLRWSEPAIVDAEDFARLMSLGVTDQWRILSAPNGGPPRVVCDWRRHDVTVARLVMEASEGQRVRMRNGTTTDLRRANLLLARGYASRNHTAHGLRGTKERLFVKTRTPIAALADAPVAFGLALAKLLEPIRPPRVALRWKPPELMRPAKTVGGRSGPK